MSSATPISYNVVYDTDNGLRYEFATGYLTIPVAIGSFLPLAGGTVTGTTTFNKALVLPPTTVAGTGTVTPDATLSSTIEITVSGNLILNGPSSGTDGQKITFRILNDGSHSVTFASGAGNYRFGTDIPSYTNSVSLTDYIGVIWNSAASRWDVVSIIQGF